MSWCINMVFQPFALAGPFEFQGMPFFSGLRPKREDEQSALVMAPEAPPGRSRHYERCKGYES